MKQAIQHLGMMLFVVSIVVSALAPARAQTTIFDVRTTRDLVGLCSLPNTDERYATALNACWGFIEGAIQYHDAVTDRRNLKRLICYPEGTTVEDGRRIFVAYGEANRGDATAMDEQAVVGLVRALAAAYPCGS